MRIGVKRSLIAAGAVTALAVCGAGSTAAAPRTPAALGPANGAAVQHLPAFSWGLVRGADAYEFQLAADPNFKGATDFRTSNTRATLTKSVPNGTYWWRVRALSKGGAVSGWSSPRSVVKRWFAKVRQLWPTQGSTVQFPKTPLTLRWAPVPGATQYLVSFGTHRVDGGSTPTDGDCDSLVGDRSVRTAATSYTVISTTPATAPDGSAKTYYWSVTPLDASRNSGNESSCTSFHWQWPSATKVTLKDLRTEPETFDPQLSWDPVPGAMRYEVEINSSEEWSPGSRVCCSRPVVGTSISPRTVLGDNTYYWRVRPIDADGNAGVWSPSGTDGTFEKVFDRAAPGAVVGTSIKNLHMRDNHGDLGSGASTSVPIVVWDPVPGAASYQVEVVPFRVGFCDWTATSSHWLAMTATTAWTPLGRPRGARPYPSRTPVAEESQRLETGQQYCVRVRARADRDDRGKDVMGDFTYLGGVDRPAFQFGGFSRTGQRGSLSPSDYLSPGRDARVTTTPYFTWEPAKGASWYVIVAKDPDFHTIVDYAFTKIPAYAPRRGSAALSYPDETTEYYWVVLPSPNDDGTQALGDPLAAAAAKFQKQSIAPTLNGPTLDAGGQLVFAWTPVDGARKYHLQVSRDANFGSVVDDVVTDSVAYTSEKSYPADVCLFWRVRAETEDRVGLAWSKPPTASEACNSAGSFKRTWPVPRLAPMPARGDEIPTVQWASVVGAAWYDLHVEQPRGGSRDFSRIRSTAATFTRMYGLGNFRWKVRANFASSTGRAVRGAYSAWHRYTRTIAAPRGPRTLVGRRSLLFTWNPKAGATSYTLEVSTQPDFRKHADSVRTSEPLYAPALDSGYQRARVFYWRVAAVDSGGNAGAFTKPLRFRLSLPKR